MRCLHQPHRHVVSRNARTYAVRAQHVVCKGTRASHREGGASAQQPLSGRAVATYRLSPTCSVRALSAIVGSDNSRSEHDWNAGAT